MEQWAYLVVWERLLEVWPIGEDEPYLGEFVDEDADWISNDSHSDAIASVMLSAEIGELYRAMELNLPEKERKALGTFLTAFAYSLAEQGSGKPEDLDRESEVILSSLSPATVQRYLALSEAIDMTTVLPVAEQALASHEIDLESAADLKTFVQVWTNVLNEAQEQNRGILVCIG